MVELPDLVSRTVLSATQERIVVAGGGRDIPSLVLLPDGYLRGRDYPLVMAVHNFAGDAKGFARLIHAERLRRLGMVIVLPQAAGLIPQWQGPGITIAFAARGADGRPVDDVAGLIDTLRTARRLYTPDGDDLNLLGFSQGATVALEIARRLDLRQDGAVRRVFVAAGSVATPLDAGLAFDGTMLVLYEPGRNGLQNIANFMTGEPSERAFLPWILQAKGCVPASRRVAGGVEETIYRCRDGRTLVHLFERTGEHAWPGQAAKYDSWLMGRGSRSHVDLTAVIAAEIETGRMPPLTQ